jgi:hypothetical protein
MTVQRLLLAGIWEVLEVCNLRYIPQKIHYINMMQNHNQQKSHSDKTFYNVSKFKCLGTTLINRNKAHDEIRRINSGNAYCYSVLKLL